MKIIPMIAAATLALSPLAANAGGLANAVQEPMKMDDMAAPSGSMSASVLIPLIFVAMIAASSASD